MIKGFTLLEALVVLSLSLGLLMIVISSVSQSASFSKKITTNQQRMEAIFHTVDTIKSDLTKCGMRLQEVVKQFKCPIFECTGDGFHLMYGVQGELIQDNAFRGDRSIIVLDRSYFKKGKAILLYDVEKGVFEFNEIESINGDEVRLKKRLGNDFFKNSQVVVLKKVAYKLYTKQHVLKRKVDKGNFQPLLEEATDFFINYYPESQSVLYRLEVNKREQIRGYIFLVNLV